VFENLEKAFEKYGRKHNKKVKEGANPAQTTEALHKILADAVDAGKAFLQDNECDIDLILNDTNTFKKIKLFSTFANNVSKTEELRKEFNVHENAIRNIYDATQPDPKIATQYKRIKEAYEYLRQIINREVEGGDFDAAVESTRVLMDDSIDSNRDALNDKVNYVINPTLEIDLRTLNLDKVEKKFKETELKYLAIVDIKDFLSAQLERMLNQNTTRIDFAQRLQEIIDKYNSKTSDVNDFFEALKDYTAKLRTEDLRAQSEGLTEAELQIFDLLYKDKLVDWHKNQRQRINVERYIMKQLYPELKEVYDKDTFREQSGKVFNFMMEQAEGRGWAYA
jgi:type I restriction enzyme R subunit